MPNQPRADNPNRFVRVEDTLWTDAKEAAAANGTTVSAVIRSSLEKYVKQHKRELAKAQQAAQTTPETW